MMQMAAMVRTISTISTIPITEMVEVVEMTKTIGTIGAIKPIEPAILRDYQRAGVAFLCAHPRCGLVDEPGLGKTIQVLAALAKTKKLPAVIFAPRSALGVWRDEIRQWLGEECYEHTLLYRGTPVQRAKLQKSFKDTWFVITTYRLVAELVELLPTFSNWQTVVCDEYHLAGLLNHKTATCKQMKKLVTGAHTNFYALSGTPFTKGPQDFYATLNIFAQGTGRFKSYWAFVTEHCLVTVNVFGYNEICSRPMHPERFREMLAAYFIRRRKSEVLEQLPDKVRQMIPIEMSKRQAQLHDILTTEMIAEWDNICVTAFSPMLLLLRSRQLLVSPKCLSTEDKDYGAGIETLTEMLENDFLDGNSALIFTPFKAGVAAITEHIKAHLPNTAVFEIHGDMKNLPSDTAKAFQEVKRANKVIVSTIKAGTAWTATDASIVYFLGYEWSNNDNVQAEDRCHRIGQSKNVQCRYFRYEDSVDMVVLNKLLSKELGNAAILDPQRFLEILRTRFRVDEGKLVNHKKAQI